jgi:hypothetical protein
MFNSARLGRGRADVGDIIYLVYLGGYYYGITNFYFFIFIYSPTSPHQIFFQSQITGK